MASAILRCFCFVLLSFAQLGAGSLANKDGTARRSLRAIQKHSPGRIRALLGRALFDYQDHLERVAAIRDTWGADPDVKVSFLDFGFQKFEKSYHNWCREMKNCPLDKYATATDELKIPDDILATRTSENDGWIWSIKKQLEDPSTQWLLLGQDMLSVHMNNLRSYLDKLDPSTSLVLGVRLKGYPRDETVVSPWGFLLSREAASSLTKAWDEGCGEEVAQNDFMFDKFDYGVGYCLRKIKADFVDTRDEHQQDRLLLWPPTRMQKDNWWDSWFPNMRTEMPSKAVSPEAFLFFFSGPKEIRELQSFTSFRGSVDSFLESTNLYHKSTLELLDPMRQSSLAASGI